MIFSSRTLSVSIDCHPAKVHEFVLNPESLPKWAQAFCKSVKSRPMIGLWKRRAGQ